MLIQILNNNNKSPRTFEARTRGDTRTIIEIRGGDSSIILIVWGGIIMSIGDFQENLSQQISVGITLVERLAVQR